VSLWRGAYTLLLDLVSLAARCSACHCAVPGRGTDSFLTGYLHYWKPALATCLACRFLRSLGHTAQYRRLCHCASSCRLLQQQDPSRATLRPTTLLLGYIRRRLDLAAALRSHVNTPPPPPTCSMADRKARMHARLKQKSRSFNLKYAAEELRRDRKVVITACLNHPGALVYCLDAELRKELEGLPRKKLQELLDTADEDVRTASPLGTHPAVAACAGSFGRPFVTHPHSA
jgi:hypothetical protein